MTLVAIRHLIHHAREMEEEYDWIANLFISH